MCGSNCVIRPGSFIACNAVENRITLRGKSSRGKLYFDCTLRLPLFSPFSLCPNVLMESGTRKLNLLSGHSLLSKHPTQASLPPTPSCSQPPSLLIILIRLRCAKKATMSLHLGTLYRPLNFHLCPLGRGLRQLSTLALCLEGKEGL